MKARWGFWNSCLIGIPWDRWRKLRAENRIDTRYRHRAALLSLASLRNSYYSRREEREYGTAIAETRIEQPPLFVLGHWRSGTTHLHNLLACDPQFGVPNGIQVTFPHSFLSTEAAFRKQFAGWVPATRPMDNVAIGLESPQEDDFAMCVSCLRSPFLGMVAFPQRADHFDRYLTFKEASEAELQAWKLAFTWFLRKLTLRHGRMLLLKSPAHTARIRLLLDLFPNARFIHVHRHPRAVIQSTLHLLHRLWPLHALQAPPDHVDDQVLARYAAVFDAFFEEISLIPAGQFSEVGFDDLLQDPVAELRRAYDELALPGFDQLQPRLLHYTQSLSGYRGNRFPEPPSEDRKRIASVCARSFEAWGYRA